MFVNKQYLFVVHSFLELFYFKVGMNDDKLLTRPKVEVTNYMFAVGLAGFNFIFLLSPSHCFWFYLHHISLNNLKFQGNTKAILTTINPRTLGT
jgi:hypothetical protein